MTFYEEIDNWEINNLYSITHKSVDHGCEQEENINIQQMKHERTGTNINSKNEETHGFCAMQEGIDAGQ